LTGFEGVLQVDGYAAYTSLAGDKKTWLISDSGVICALVFLLSGIPKCWVLLASTLRGARDWLSLAQARRGHERGGSIAARKCLNLLASNRISKGWSRDRSRQSFRLARRSQMF
jgi:hypothetical protein